MNKHDVMKALALCNSHGGDACAKCPYAWTDNCYIQMTHDAIALLIGLGRSGRGFWF